MLDVLTIKCDPCKREYKYDILPQHNCLQPGAPSRVNSATSQRTGRSLVVTSDQIPPVANIGIGQRIDAGFRTHNFSTKFVFERYEFINSKVNFFGTD